MTRIPPVQPPHPYPGIPPKKPRPVPVPKPKRYGQFVFNTRYIEFAYIPRVFCVLRIGSRMFPVLHLLHPFVRAWRFTRGLLPSFWAVGLRCCDHGGRVMRSYPVMALNDYHLRYVVEPRWNGSGDGETWERISFFEYLRANKGGFRHD